eukprot:CAMPEP_0198305642 /NCGR_PEP_ID=MMETSP1449-20131203/58009_1 /TAXON_ID=420275 /ORGANISM="Attheya septentrionalis, Strain CCMP2084" /LENGTH=588 /DNA_ID=CAMNT_0044008177 /DNA_START=352 /DNA_END=2118 /DNA_ORIENTATION=-
MNQEEIKLVSDTEEKEDKTVSSSKPQHSKVLRSPKVTTNESLFHRIQKDPNRFLMPEIMKLQTNNPKSANVLAHGSEDSPSQYKERLIHYWLYVDDKHNGWWYFRRKRKGNTKKIPMFQIDNGRPVCRAHQILASWFQEYETSSSSSSSVPLPSMELCYLVLAKSLTLPHFAIPLLRTMLDHDQIPDRHAFLSYRASLQRTCRKFGPQTQVVYALDDGKHVTNMSNLYPSSSLFATTPDEITGPTSFELLENEIFCVFHRAYDQQDGTQKEATNLEPRIGSDHDSILSSDISFNRTIAAWLNSENAQDRHDAPILVERLVQNEVSKERWKNNCILKAWSRASTRSDRFDRAERLLLSMEVSKDPIQRPDHLSYSFALETFRGPRHDATSRPDRAENLLKRMVQTSQENHTQPPTIRDYHTVLQAFCFIDPTVLKTVLESSLSTNDESAPGGEQISDTTPSMDTETRQLLIETMYHNLACAQELLDKMKNDYWSGSGSRIQPEKESHEIVIQGWLNGAEWIAQLGDPRGLHVANKCVEQAENCSRQMKSQVTLGAPLPTHNDHSSSSEIQEAIAKTRENLRFLLEGEQS